MDDARKYRGLLGRAVQQLILNWENALNPRVGGRTWMGLLLQRIHTVWPRFMMRYAYNLTWTGVPPPCTIALSLSRQFQADLFIKKWQVRQCSVIASRSCSTRQDFILFHILNALGSSALRDKMASNLPVTENDTLESPIFLELPKVNTDSFRVLLRTLAGLEDFARTNSHYARRKCHPTLRTSHYSRGCLYCCFHHSMHCMDSEWHSIFDCPWNLAAREEFLLLTKLDHFFECSSSVEQLALLIAHIREKSTLVHALARFALQIQTNRRNWFRQLSTEANKRALAAKLEVVTHAFDSVWI